MKLDLFSLGQKNEELMAELPGFFDAWKEEVQRAKPIFDIEGERLEKIARDLPHHQVFYAQKALEARAVVKWLEVNKGRTESRYIKNYNQSPRALGVKEQAQYLQGEKEIVELNQLIVEAELCRGQLEEIVEAVKQLGWMVGNITKLRVAEMQDAVI